MFNIAIPSYHRSGKQDTLTYLTTLGVPKDRIFIFVQDKDDYSAYQQYKDQCNIVFAEADCVTKARNNILNTLSTNLVMMDDDIRRISVLKDKHLVPLEDKASFDKIFDDCFKHTKDNKGKMFGIYPVYNDYFMSQTVSTRVTVNTVLGFTENFGLRFDERYKAKEDIELCARILKAGGNVFRYNYLTVDAKHRTNDGGCHKEWHSGENEKAVKMLCLSYPTILKPKKADEVRVIIKDKKIKRNGGKE